MTTSPCFPSTTTFTSATTSPVRRDPLSAYVSLYGEIDMASADTALATLHEAMDGLHQRLDIDLADVRFLDSSGISILMRCWRRAGQIGCRLSVINARPNVYRVMQIAGVVEVLDVARAA